MNNYPVRKEILNNLPYDSIQIPFSDKEQKVSFHSQATQITLHQQ